MIDHVARFLQGNIIVFLAAVLVPLKWLIVRLLHDREAEAAAILSLPEDLCYIALGLVLGDTINRTGAFHRHFAGSAFVNMDLFVTVGFNIVVAIAVHVLSQMCAKQFKMWRAADSSRPGLRDPIQGELGLPSMDNNVRMLMLRHLSLFTIGYAAQLLIAGLWLHWVAKVVANA